MSLEIQIEVLENIVIAMCLGFAILKAFVLLAGLVVISSYIIEWILIKKKELVQRESKEIHKQK